MTTVITSPTHGDLSTTTPPQDGVHGIAATAPMPIRKEVGTPSQRAQHGEEVQEGSEALQSCPEGTLSLTGTEIEPRVQRSAVSVDSDLFVQLPRGFRRQRVVTRDGEILEPFGLPYGKTAWMVYEHLLRHGDWISRAGLARKIGKHPSTVGRAVKRLGPELIEVGDLGIRAVPLDPSKLEEVSRSRNVYGMAMAIQENYERRRTRFSWGGDRLPVPRPIRSPQNQGRPAFVEGQVNARPDREDTAQLDDDICWHDNGGGAA